MSESLTLVLSTLPMQTLEPGPTWNGSCATAFVAGEKIRPATKAIEKPQAGPEFRSNGLVCPPPGYDAPTLDFVARRRYRTIERMALFVNPNGRGYFRYPDTCLTNFSDGRWHWKVNVTATTYWEPVQPPLDVPIWLKKPPTAPATFDPVAAIGSLFTPKKNACEGNLLDCATTMNVVLMDSLLEAADPGVLTTKLAAKHVVYLAIVHVNPPIIQQDSFFLTDPTAEGLFVKGSTALEDLQVGDHVYIRNHELYKTLRPTGSWNGEHALVTDCGNRRIDSDKGFRFMGHGMPHGGETGAIPRFYKGLLNEINTYLYRSYRLAGIFLNYLKSGKTSPPPGKVQKQSKSVTDPNGNTFIVDYYFFDVDFSYTDFEGKPKKGQKLATKSEHGFVVAHSVSGDQFFLHHRRKLSDAVADGVLNKRYGILFKRDVSAPAGLDPNDPVGWELIFLDADGVSEQNYALFERKGRSKALSMVPLEMYELYQEPLARTTPGSDDVFTTRHRVSLDPAYLTFLKGAKALP